MLGLVHVFLSKFLGMVLYVSHYPFQIKRAPCGCSLLSVPLKPQSWVVNDCHAAVASFDLSVGSQVIVLSVLTQFLNQDFSELFLPDLPLSLLFSGISLSPQVLNIDVPLIFSSAYAHSAGHLIQTLSCSYYLFDCYSRIISLV